MIKSKTGLQFSFTLLVISSKHLNLAHHIVINKYLTNSVITTILCLPSLLLQSIFSLFNLKAFILSRYNFSVTLFQQENKFTFIAQFFFKYYKNLQKN